MAAKDNPCLCLKQLGCTIVRQSAGVEDWLVHLPVGLSLDDLIHLGEDIVPRPDMSAQTSASAGAVCASLDSACALRLAHYLVSKVK